MSAFRLILALAFFCLGMCGAAEDFRFPDTGAGASGRATLLAIDDVSLLRGENIRCVLMKPTVRLEPVLAPSVGNPDAPDSMAAHFYGTVLHDEGKYRMWYYAVSLRAAPEDLRQGPVCYAESEDGIHWTKPNLGQVEINGKTANNGILLPDASTQCAMVLRDDGDANPDRRYKMLYTALDKTWTFRTATSPDGLHWTPGAFPTARFLESGSLIRFGGRYIVHGQGGGEDQDGNPEGRHGYASTSTDFEHWDQRFTHTFGLPEPADVAARGLLGDYPQVHLGVGAASFDNVAVGLYGLWRNPAQDKVRRDAWYGSGLITCDFGLLVSNDGVKFREVEPGAVYISCAESPSTPGSVPSDPTILCQANGILNVGNETRIYHGRWRNATTTEIDYYAEIALATLPRDRWGGLELAEGATSGTVWSAPFQLGHIDWDIRLNADNADLITVSIADEAGNLIPGCSGENAGVGRPTDELESGVQWKTEQFLRLGGRTVKLRLDLRRDGNRSPKMFAVYLQNITCTL